MKKSLDYIGVLKQIMVSIVDTNTAEQDMGCYCRLPFGLWPKTNYNSHSIGSVVDFLVIPN